MITGELRNKIDRIWETFWTGGITNPLDVIEQFTYLLFIKQLDDVETTKENEANFLGVEYEALFPEECQKYRWSKFKNLGSADEMYELVSMVYFRLLRTYIRMEILPMQNTWGMQFSRFLLQPCYQKL